MTRMSRFGRLGLIALLGLLLAFPAGAANPLLNMFKRVDADPKKQYPLEEKHGPWMIMVTVFRGETAAQDAQSLVIELRKNLGVQAFTHERVSDYSTTWKGNHVNAQGGPDKWRYAHAEVLEEVAVMVGNFVSLDDPDAISTLANIKKYEPTTVKFGLSSGTSATTNELERYRQNVNKMKKRGPLHNALLVTNPLIPKEVFRTASLDKLVLSMNSEVEHSLLKCPGQYSVKVATFRGSTILDQSKVRALEKDKLKLESKLAEAAEKAHLLTTALRKQGYEAYQFHDRYESVVCIGSFASVGTQRQDGKTEINPDVLKIMTHFQGQTDNRADPGTIAGAMHPKGINVVENGQTTRITFDIQPMPILVPKQSVQSALQR
jgi:hypothetical protein